MHEWSDERLVWNPDQYAGVKFIHIMADRLWLPDFALYDNADGDFIVSELVRTKVFHNGTIQWRPPIITKTFCEIRVDNFPFDVQNCTLKIGPWTYDGTVVDMSNFNNSYNEKYCCQAIDLR